MAPMIFSPLGILHCARGFFERYQVRSPAGSRVRLWKFNLQQQPQEPRFLGEYIFVGEQYTGGYGYNYNVCPC